MKKQTATTSGLEQFLRTLPWSDLEAIALPFCSDTHASAAAFLRTLQSEAQLGLGLISGELAHDRRILEIGSGMGLLAGYLHSCGYNVVALEPGLGGFGISAALASRISSEPAFASLMRLDIPAEKLAASDRGEFDLIYSVNVLEHIPSLEASLRAMASVLRAGGLMVHTCPNYTIPYEPHFGLPLVPLLPQVTAMVAPSLGVESQHVVHG